jgi:hypothetical protein
VRKKAYEKVVKKIEKHLEPGEQVVGAFQARESYPYTVLPLGLLGLWPVLFYKQRMIVVTDRKIYFLNAFTQKKVLKSFPREGTSFTTDRKVMMMLEVKIGPATVWAPKIEQKNVGELEGKLGAPESAPATQPA